MFRKWLKTTICLFLLWIILSGRFEFKFLIFGIISACVMAYICIPSMNVMDKYKKNSYFILDINIWSFIKYSAWLFVEIIKSSFDVSKIVLSPHMKMEAQVIEFECWFKNPMATSMLVNSIILTPGTVTVDVIDESLFVVHALTNKAANGLLEGTMQKKIALLFNEV